MAFQKGMSGETMGSSQEHVETKQEKRARAISAFIEDSVIGENASLSKEEEKDIVEYYKKMRPREKADALYSKMMAFMVDEQADTVQKQEAKEQGETFEPEITDPYLISEIKVLFSDPKVKELIPGVYGEARVDQKRLQISALGKLWEEESAEVTRKENEYRALE